MYNQAGPVIDWKEHVSKLEETVLAESPSSVNINVCIYENSPNTLGSLQAPSSVPTSKYASKLIIAADKKIITYDNPYPQEIPNPEADRVSEAFVMLNIGLQLADRLKENKTKVKIKMNDLPFNKKVKKEVFNYLAQLKAVCNSYAAAVDKA